MLRGMMMSEELKPCPKCGRTDKLEILEPDYVGGPDAENGHYENLFFIRCNRCNSKNSYSKWGIVKRWNTRPIEDQKDAQIATLKAEVEILSNNLSASESDCEKLNKHIEMLESDNDTLKAEVLEMAEAVRRYEFCTCNTCIKTKCSGCEIHNTEVRAAELIDKYKEEE